MWNWGKTRLVPGASFVVLVQVGMCPDLWALPREQNSSAAEQVLAEVAKTMQEYPVAFKGARILTGEEEGAYGWITINYLLDSFTKVGEGSNPAASLLIFGFSDF